MSDLLYEKDLASMKYAILKSPRHDRMVKEIAGDLGMQTTKLRRYMMDRFDMILMENLPARYEQGKKDLQSDSLPGRDLGSLLYSRAIPLIDEEKMATIIAAVTQLLKRGDSEKEAVAAGKRMIREAITG
jgi:hypothetical protein